MILEINYALDKTTDGATHSGIPAIQGEAEEELTEKESPTVRRVFQRNGERQTERKSSDKGKGGKDLKCHDRDARRSSNEGAPWTGGNVPQCGRFLSHDRSDQAVFHLASYFRRSGAPER